MQSFLDAIGQVYQLVDSPDEQDLTLDVVITCLMGVIEDIRRETDLSDQFWDVRQTRLNLEIGREDYLVTAPGFGRALLAQVETGQGMGRRIRLATLPDQISSATFIDPNFDLRYPGTLGLDTIAFWGDGTDAARGTVVRARMLPRPVAAETVLVHFAPMSVDVPGPNARLPVVEAFQYYAVLRGAHAALPYHRSLSDSRYSRIAKTLEMRIADAARKFRRYVNRRTDNGVDQPRGFRVGVRRTGQNVRF